MKTQKDSKKQYAKVVLIISCVFTITSIIAISLLGIALNHKIENMPQERYLYENGIEVDAHIKSYYKSSPKGSARYTFHIIYEYVDDNSQTYSDEYIDTVACWTSEEIYEREQYIKQMITDEITMKMLVDDNGACCLTVYKENLINNTHVILFTALLVVSSVVLGVCIFGIVRQSKTLRRLR